MRRLKTAIKTLVSGFSLRVASFSNLARKKSLILRLGQTVWMFYTGSVAGEGHLLQIELVTPVRCRAVEYIKSKENPADLCSLRLRSSSLMEANPGGMVRNFSWKLKTNEERRLWNQLNWCKKRASGVDELDHSQIQDQTASKAGVKWSFDSPLAPHFGGVREVMIKSPKNALRVVLGNGNVNDEELMTAFVGVEALLNSHPLTYQLADPKDGTPLTTSPFLHGQIEGVSAPESVDQVTFSPRSRWRQVQGFKSRAFWREWLPKY